MLVTHGLIKSENDGCIISGEEYMEKIANKFADWLVCCGAPGDNREIYAYAVECLLNTVLIFSVIIVVSIILGKFLPTLLWILFFLPVRHTSGGLHAPNHIGCFLFSVSVGIGCMFLAPLLVNKPSVFFAGICASIVIIFVFAPVIHSNHPLSEQSIQKTKKHARIIILLESAFMILLYFLTKDSVLAFSALLGVLSATLSTFAGRLLNQ